MVRYECWWQQNSHHLKGQDGTLWSSQSAPQATLSRAVWHQIQLQDCLRGEFLYNSSFFNVSRFKIYKIKGGEGGSRQSSYSWCQLWLLESLNLSISSVNWKLLNRYWSDSDHALWLLTLTYQMKDMIVFPSFDKQAGSLGKSCVKVFFTEWNCSACILWLI